MYLKSDLNSLSEEYFCSERNINAFLFAAIKEVYFYKKIVSFDIENGYIFEQKSRIFCFLPSKKEQNLIKKSFVKMLQKHKKKIFIRNNFKRLRRVYEDHFNHQIVKAIISKIEKNNIEMEIKNNQFKIINAKIIVNIDDFFDVDLIKIGHNFDVLIKNIRVENKKIILKGVRKDVQIIKYELVKILDFVEKSVSKKIDFEIINIDLKRHFIRLNVYEKYLDSILGKVSEMLQKKIGFRLFWKLKRKESDGKS